MAAPTQPRIFWPVTITAGTNDKIDFTVGAGAAEAATVAAATYYSPNTLASAVQTALTNQHANGWSVTQATGTNLGKFTVSGSSSFQLLFSSGANAGAGPRDILGFGTVDTASATSVTGQYQMQNAWLSTVAPVRDTRNGPIWDAGRRAQTRSLGGRGKTIDFATDTARDVTIDFLDAYKTWISDESASQLNQAIERFFRSGVARFRWWDDQTNTADIGGGGIFDYTAELSSVKDLPFDRKSPGLALYKILLRMRPYS